MKTLTIAARFCGPASSSNGGYFAGRVAALATRTVTVRLLKPPPLDTELSVEELEGGALRVLAGAEPVGEAQPALLTLDVRPVPDYLEAVEASRHYAGFRYHRFPTCFVCGTQRVRGDGMRIFAGPVGDRGIVAAPWVPDASLDAGDGKVHAEFMSAALDCPGYYAVAPDDRMMLLAAFTAHVDRRVHVGESCTVVGWAIGSSGRKHEAGTALFDGKGELCGRARALWIEPRAAVETAQAL
ncbi:MAG TPA: hypothetical protein VET46_11935 [Steroidobacteraceae bacterium]|nr:hypothetical protein [Steroidobacteraceae bacterium]